MIKKKKTTKKRTNKKLDSMFDLYLNLYESRLRKCWGLFDRILLDNFKQPK